MSGLTVEFLRDIRRGGHTDQPARVADQLAEFVSAARSTLDVAIYDVRLDPPLDAPIVDALAGAAARGVEVRIAYDAGKPDAQTTVAFARAGADPAPVGTQQWLHDHFDGTSVALRPISSTSGHLMHDKFIVRDRTSTKATVWTGSTNWTNDAWTYQENNIVQIRSRKLAAGYSIDFDEMWTAGAIKGTGADADGATTVDRHRVEWAFGPGDGRAIDTHLVQLIAAADHEVAIASMVITSATILGALHDALDRGVTVHGIYDSGQMNPIVAEWKTSPTGKAKAAMFTAIAAHLAAKKSTRYSPTSRHDFMHNKIVVIDHATVATGSHNLSANATGNAENSVTVNWPDVAGQYVTYITELETAYAKSASTSRRSGTSTPLTVQEPRSSPHA
jgi:phosphatidylserine/phosphatidylglycerophosphate/cardiolipin synthase-like enzyme